MTIPTLPRTSVASTTALSPQATKLLETGQLISAMAEHGEAIWLWLGEDIFQEFTLSGISYPLRMSFPDDPVATRFRIPRHLFLFWLRGFYKSSMIDEFLRILQPPWSVHSIGSTTAESVRGSVSSGGGSYSFHPPGMLMGDIVAVPEFHNITTVKNVGPVLLDWWGTGDVSVSLVKFSSALKNQGVKNDMARYGVTPLDGRYSFHTDSVSIAACHTETDKLKRFPPALYDRLLVRYFEPETLDSTLAKDVAKRALNTRRSIDVLSDSWGFYRRMTVDGMLPTIPGHWIDALPEIGPRLISNYASTVYSHAFIMQPKRHGHLNPPYSELIIEEEDHLFAVSRIGLYKYGQEVILAHLGGRGSRRNLEEEILDYLRRNSPVTSNEVSTNIGCSSRRVTQILREYLGSGVNRIGSRGPGVQWEWDGSTEIGNK